MTPVIGVEGRKNVRMDLVTRAIPNLRQTVIDLIDKYPDKMGFTKPSAFGTMFLQLNPTTQVRIDVNVPNINMYVNHLVERVEAQEFFDHIRSNLASK